MNNFSDFHQYLQDNQKIFLAWGEYVANKISKQLEEKIRPVSLSNFLKIDVKPRVKEISSALAKVHLKDYKNPQSEMTDLVGIRFVVLLVEHMDKVCEVIEDINPEWTASLSKDFSGEIKGNPKAFDYQSKHYEIRPKKDFHLNSLIIPKDLCCEVQVRSLLQHAYAELVHDNIYKPNGIVPLQAVREVAKSMALMETTDDLFSKTLQILHKANEPQEKLLTELSDLYLKYIGIKPDANKKTNIIFFDTFSDYVDKSLVTEISDVLDDNKFITEFIKDRAQSIYFFKQPVVLLIYWLLETEKLTPDEIHSKWPLPSYFSALESVFSDLDKQPRD